METLFHSFELCIFYTDGNNHYEYDGDGDNNVGDPISWSSKELVIIMIVIISIIISIIIIIIVIIITIIPPLDLLKRWEKWLQAQPTVGV